VRDLYQFVRSETGFNLVPPPQQQPSANLGFYAPAEDGAGAELESRWKWRSGRRGYGRMRAEPEPESTPAESAAAAKIADSYRLGTSGLLVMALHADQANLQVTDLEMEDRSDPASGTADVAAQVRLALQRKSDEDLKELFQGPARALALNRIEFSDRSSSGKIMVDCLGEVLLLGSFHESTAEVAGRVARLAQESL
jgi:hypothetical protein